jgi:hypothetical protein
MSATLGCKFVPVIVIVVPPAAGPLLGLTDVIVGAVASTDCGVSRKTTTPTAVKIANKPKHAGTTTTRLNHQVGNRNGFLRYILFNRNIIRTHTPLLLFASVYFYH